MGSFEDDVRRMGAARSSMSGGAEKHIRMLAEHARVSHERALGFVSLMRKYSIETDPVYARVNTPTTKRGGFLGTKQVPGRTRQEFPQVGQGWALTEFLQQSDHGIYLVVLNNANADAIGCFATSRDPNGIPAKTATFHEVSRYEQNQLSPERSPFFHDREYELLQQAALRLVGTQLQ